MGELIDQIANRRNMIGNKERRQLTTRNLALVLLYIFPQHIGQENGISKEDLYKKLFKKKYNEESFADYMRWEFVKRALHMLRQQSNCFIVSEQVEKRWYFFVVRDMQDADIYRDHLDAVMKKMRSMQRRAYDAVEKEWYKQPFVLPGRRSQLSLNKPE